MEYYLNKNQYLNKNEYQFSIIEYALSGLSKIIWNYLQYNIIFIHSKNIYSAPIIIQACLAIGDITTTTKDIKLIFWEKKLQTR